MDEYFNHTGRQTESVRITFFDLAHERKPLKHGCSWIFVGCALRSNTLIYHNSRRARTTHPTKKQGFRSSTVGGIFTGIAILVLIVLLAIFPVGIMLVFIWAAPPAVFCDGHLRQDQENESHYPILDDCVHDGSAPLTTFALSRMPKFTHTTPMFDDGSLEITAQICAVYQTQSIPKFRRRVVLPDGMISSIIHHILTIRSHS